MPRPMTSPSLTKTQPTGVSSLFRASSAYHDDESAMSRLVEVTEVDAP
jgi:hypothetical protein